MWIGLADKLGSQFSPTGLRSRPTPKIIEGRSRRLAAAAAGRGTILLETETAQFLVPRKLIELDCGAQLELSLTEAERLHFHLTLDGQVWEHSLPLQLTDRRQTLRISYSWDAAVRGAVLSVYQPRRGHLAQALLPAPRPMPWAFLEALCDQGPALCEAQDMSFIAVSQAFEPAGPMPGLTPLTPIMTPEGLKPVEDIAPGDHVITTGGSSEEVIGTVRRVLPARGSFLPYSVRTPNLGVHQSVCLSGEARVLLTGPDVEFMLGVEAVFAEARQLADAKPLVGHAPRATMRYHHLILGGVHSIAGAVGLESLNLGKAPATIARATTLWADVEDLESVDHRGVPYPRARSYEVATLNAMRAA